MPYCTWREEAGKQSASACTRHVTVVQIFEKEKKNSRWHVASLTDGRAWAAAPQAVARLVLQCKSARLVGSKAQSHGNCSTHSTCAVELDTPVVEMPR